MSSYPALPPVELCSDLKSADYDAIVVVTETIDSVPNDDLKSSLKTIASLDAKAEGGLFVAPTSLPAKRIVFSGTGPLKSDYVDVRSYSNAAKKGVERAIAAGATAPLFVFAVGNRFPKAATVAMLGALEALYNPLEMREAKPEKAAFVTKLGVYGTDAATVELVRGLEAGRIASRDIGGSDPERMAAPRVEEYVRKTFEGTNIKIEVIKGQSTFEKEYPCLAAVNRCASGIERHDARVIWLTYTPEGPIEKTIMMVGKGITYDTGGLDIKAGGIMAGMSRDKCGAAGVAGVLKACSLLKPKGVKVVGAMCMVRNSCGSNGYVSDEIITSRAGVRLRVGNTDAEGRMAMVDVLCHMKEKALNETNPHLMTIATLTGHEVIAMGLYSAIIDNGPAKLTKNAQRVQDVGDRYGDMFEVSTLRPDDLEFIRDKSGKFVQVLQANNEPSVRTMRGHQYPAAFLLVTSGLDKHGSSDEKPLKYSHLDVAGSSGGLPGITTGSAVVALTMDALGQ